MNITDFNIQNATIQAMPVSADHVCRVTSVRPKNPVVSHPYIKAE